MATASNAKDIGEESKEYKKTFIRKAHELFQVCDKNDNGFISKRDMWKLCDELSLTPEQLDEVFINLDEDRSGYLTKEEFVKGFASYLDIDLNELNKEEENEAKRNTEQEEEAELEDLLNRIDEHSIEDNAEANSLWNTVNEKNPEIKSVIEDLEKKLRSQQTNDQKFRKDFFSLHHYYYQRIYTVMQHLDRTKKQTLTNGKLWESLDPAKTTESSSKLLQEKGDQSSVGFNGAFTITETKGDILPSYRQQSLNYPPIKARTFLESNYKPSSTNQDERQNNSNNLVNGSLGYSHILPIRNSPERLFKIIFVGDSGVGKTSFIHRFCYDKFLSTFHATVGIDFRVKTFAVDGRLVALQLWDTAGQERYRSLAKQYFRKTDGIIFMYDITCQLSFHNIRNWMAQVKDNSDCNLVSVVVGNKVDLIEEHTSVVSTGIGKELAKKHEFLFYETSCKTGEGIWNIMRQMACALQLTEDKEIERIYEIQKFKEERKCC